MYINLTEQVVQNDNIDNLFKAWKSFFQIHKYKEIKKEFLEYDLYGQFIRILLCSSMMFKMRQLFFYKG
ncbi:hypothetical protein COL11_24580 [Bacillus anthracis]|nr:hypothetical protein CN337_23765 [Bacillus anthracis]PFR83639.1 hypothetical protein COK43_27185 [Bacillus cereus]PFW33132.1 hypothetical protein COL11_24580 [Bacillus anthracis]PGK04401.1 hypothetical protein CN892_23925 [Bacillus anthracis]PGT41272.1 hypothetical protein COC97_11060 [Bacillus anthracis]